MTWERAQNKTLLNFKRRLQWTTSWPSSKIRTGAGLDDYLLLLIISFLPMAGPSWIVDSTRIATKIKSASAASDTTKWKSNPTRACPNCHHSIDNSDVTQEWPGLPRGVKFDPSDQEIIWHLLTKVGEGNLKPHPFIDEFITTVSEDDGICYTHPQNLPDVKQDGSMTHFFHRAIKAYNTGTRKRRKIHGENSGDVRWHKTGRTKPVKLNGVQKGCKKIMVLYMSAAKGGKAEKTNWVMHQYHLGTEEDEREGEYVISKIFYQQQQLKQSDIVEGDFPEIDNEMVTTVDPVTPKSAGPGPPRIEKGTPNPDMVQDFIFKRGESHGQDPQVCFPGDEVIHACEENKDIALVETEDQSGLVEGNNDNNLGEESKWWDSESQYLIDSQQLVEGLSLCDEFLQSQSPNRDGNADNVQPNNKPRLSDYAQLGPEHLKKDLEECQNLVLDSKAIELDTPPDFRLSQLEFGSQDSFLAWGGSKVTD